MEEVPTVWTDVILTSNIAIIIDIEIRLNYTERFKYVTQLKM